MSDIAIKLELVEEIEQLRKQLGEEWKHHHLLSHPSVVLLSQMLDVKICEYQRLLQEVD